MSETIDSIVTWSLPPRAARGLRKRCFALWFAFRFARQTSSRVRESLIPPFQASRLGNVSVSLKFLRGSKSGSSSLKSPAAVLGKVARVLTSSLPPLAHTASPDISAQIDLRRADGISGEERLQVDREVRPAFAARVPYPHGAPRLLDALRPGQIPYSIGQND
jgi:hypothetical protein